MSNHGTEKGERTHASSFIEFPISHKGGGRGVEEDTNFHEPQTVMWMKKLFLRWKLLSLYLKKAKFMPRSWTFGLCFPTCKMALNGLQTKVFRGFLKIPWKARDELCGTLVFNLLLSLLSGRMEVLLPTYGFWQCFVRDRSLPFGLYQYKSVACGLQPECLHSIWVGHCSEQICFL